MTIQDTSRRAYENLVENGLLLGKQQQIMAVLLDLEQATSGEVLAKIRGVKNVNAWRGRFTELQLRGLIREVDVRACRISGRECIVWAPTGRDKPLDPNAINGRRSHALSKRKKGRWQAAAQGLAAVVDIFTKVADDPAVRIMAERALAEYARLGGRVAS